MKFRLWVGGVMAFGIAGGCARSRWDGTTRHWGTLREVLRDGQVSGKVRVLEVAGPGSVGVGALANLAGEITVLEGEVWISRPSEGGRTVTRRGADPDVEAAFLALARVPAWKELPVERDLSPADLEQLIAGHLPGRFDTLPFIVKGRLADVRAHVLNGRCPFAADPNLRGEPVRFESSTAEGSLVGFFTVLPAGVLAHHGSRLHVHVLVREPAPMMGHLDDVRILRGSKLRIPVFENRS